MATEEQATTGDLISESVQAILQISDESARDIEKVVQAAEELDSLTNNLRGLVQELVVGADAPTGTPRDHGVRAVERSRIVPLLI